MQTHITLKSYKRQKFDENSVITYKCTALSRNASLRQNLLHVWIELVRTEDRLLICVVAKLTSLRALCICATVTVYCEDDTRLCHHCSCSLESAPLSGNMC